MMPFYQHGNGRKKLEISKNISLKYLYGIDVINPINEKFIKFWFRKEKWPRLRTVLYYFKEIVNKEDTEVPFMVSKGLVIDNSVIFLGQKGKNKQLLKVTL